MEKAIGLSAEEMLANVKKEIDKIYADSLRMWRRGRGDVAPLIPLFELPWSRCPQGSRERTIRCQVFHNWPEEGSNSCNHLH